MTSMQKKKLVYTLCTLALLTAMMVLLTMTVSIQTPFFKLSFGSLGKQPGLSGNFCLPQIPFGQRKHHKSLCRTCRVQSRIDPVKKGKQISCCGHIKFFDVVIHQVGKYGYQSGSGVRLFLIVPPLRHILLCAIRF